MAFSRPTRTKIQERVAADIERHSGQKATSRGDIYYPLTQAIAAVSHGLHGNLQYNVDQIFDDSCDDENLLRRAAEMGVYRVRAYRAAGTIKVTGNDGAELLEQTLLQADDEIRYRTTEAAVITNGMAIVKVTAINAGNAANQQVMGTLRFISTQLDIDSEVTVVRVFTEDERSNVDFTVVTSEWNGLHYTDSDTKYEGIAGGSDIEPIERVRERLSNRRKRPVMGGNKNDYIQWALEAHSDVTRAWCYPLEKGLGTVTVRFVTDNLDTPIPTARHIEAVKNYIDEQRPVGMKQFSVDPLVEKHLELEFTTLTPNTKTVRDGIIAELNDLLLRQAKPGGVVLLSQIHEAISLTPGEQDHRITLQDDIDSLPGELITLGKITWPVSQEKE